MLHTPGEMGSHVRAAVLCALEREGFRHVELFRWLPPLDTGDTIEVLFFAERDNTPRAAYAATVTSVRAITIDTWRKGW